MSPIKLLGFVVPVLLLATGCGVTIRNETDVAAPQRYRPEGAEKQWLIEATLDSEIHNDGWQEWVAGRTVEVTINGEKAVEGRFAADSIGTPTGTFDGSYGDSEVHVDCSSQVKTLSWIEVRCRVVVDGETATTLIM